MLLVSEKDPSEVQSILKRFSWATRIENIKLKIYSSDNSYAKENLSKNTDIFFQIVVVLFGAGVYWFFGLFVVFFTVIYYLSIRSGWISISDYRSVGKALLVSVLAISTSEILVDIFVNKRAIEEQHPFICPLLCTHIGLGLYLLYMSVRTVKVKST